MLQPTSLFAHGGGLDPRGGHFDRKVGVYHCHRSPCSDVGSQHPDAGVGADSPQTYHRSAWGPWQDVDGDCLDTRAEILRERSEAPVQVTGCVVRAGRWTGPYTGKVFTVAQDVDLDHVVPLGHAHAAGGWAWSAAAKRKFANDPDNLLVVDDSTNAAKGLRAPHEWMPPDHTFWCAYLARWQTIKARYQLEQGADEQAFLNAHTCLPADAVVSVSPSSQ